MGAPKAALTPAAVPTARSFLFSKSFLKYYVIPSGKYALAYPTIAPI